jgi:phosphatidylinositol glycan class M
MRDLIIGGIGLRFVLLLVAHVMDTYSHLKFTDIDYVVFTDATSRVFEGGSPYDRVGYRYTPLLAWILYPNNWVKDFGKLVFIACDLLTGIVIQRLLERRALPISTVRLYSAVWLLNPFIAAISTRGSSESILSALVLSVLLAFESGRWVLGSFLFGFAVHFKIYPIIYAVPLWFYLGRASNNELLSLKRIHINFFSWKRLAFGIISAGVFFSLSGLMYYL